jgi:multicomponent Na+:H+ antiporter subunit B
VRENLFTSFTTRFMVSFLFMLSLYLLLQGHHDPGGGFIGGLVGSAAIIAFYVSRNSGASVEARHRMSDNFWGYVLFTGIAVAMLSGFWGLFFGDGYMDAVWFDEPIPGIGKIGTPLVFDSGVFLAVIAVTVSITRVLANMQHPREYYRDEDDTLKVESS